MRTSRVPLVLLRALTFAPLSSGRSQAQPKIPTPPAAPKANWWRETIVHQLYPRRFQDGNDDGPKPRYDGENMARQNILILITH